MTSMITRPIDTAPWEIIPCGNEKRYEPLKKAIEREDVAKVEHFLSHGRCPPLAYEEDNKITFITIPHKEFPLPGHTFFDWTISLDASIKRLTITLAI